MKNKVRAGMVGVLTTLITGLAGAASGPTWTPLTPVPATGSGVEGMSVAVVGDQIIATLGYDNGLGDTNTTRIYDIASDIWSTGSVAPVTSSEGAAVSHGGLLYAIGGRGTGYDALSSYQPATDTWTALAPMPLGGRAGLAAAEEGNIIYAIGGRSNTGGPCSGSPVSRVEAYDIDTGVWSSVASLPAPRSDLAAATIGGKIYVFGGCDAVGNFLNTVDVYNPITNTWSASPTDMPTARAAMYAVAAKGGTVYVIGGYNPGVAGGADGLSTNEAYKVATNTWTGGLLPMPTDRAEAGAVGHGGRIFVVGGAKPGFGASVNANEVFKP